MSGLDDTRRELQRFEQALAAFNDGLRSTVRELGRIEDQLQGVWDDEFRRDFEQRREQFSGPVEEYTRRDAERYARFLRERLNALQRYFDRG